MRDDQVLLRIARDISSAVQAAMQAAEVPGLNASEVTYQEGLVDGFEQASDLVHDAVACARRHAESPPSTAPAWAGIDSAPRDGTPIAGLSPLMGEYDRLRLWTMARVRWLTAEQCLAEFGGALSDYEDGWSDDAGDNPGPVYWLPAECLPPNWEHEP